MIAGIAKSYCLTPDYVLYEMSYVNVLMYGAVLPSYKSYKKEKTNETNNHHVVKADDPRNKDILKAFFKTIKD